MHNRFQASLLSSTNRALSNITPQSADGSACSPGKDGIVHLDYRSQLLIPNLPASGRPCLYSILFRSVVFNWCAQTPGELEPITGTKTNFDLQVQIILATTKYNNESSGSTN